MSYACVYSRAQAGMSAPLVRVEVHLSAGLPKFSIVGLAEKAVNESKDRVRSAILNSQFEFPMRRITVNLSPADLPKEGGRFDLAIALGVLIASHQLKTDSIFEYEFAAELSLDGTLRPTKGVLPFAIETQKAKRKMVVAKQNADETSLASKLQTYVADDLLSVCAHLKGESILPVFEKYEQTHQTDYPLDLSQVKGQTHGKRALEIAAAGQHSILFYGPPGTGKTMLAQRLNTILPMLDESDALEVAAVYSLARGGFDTKTWRHRPFRSPHHNASSVAMAGGGRPLRPGEISLAHHGILFLDELPEYNRQVLEALREPLEAGAITISRAAQQVKYPANFQLVAAMNPCPCGYYGDKKKMCRCSGEQLNRYQNKLSGPLLDRIDLHVAMPRLEKQTLWNNVTEESSETVRQRVKEARTFQQHRLKGDLFKSLSGDQRIFLEGIVDKLNLSARAVNRVLRVARTIADLAASPAMETSHITEALSFRSLSQ